MFSSLEAVLREKGTLYSSLPGNIKIDTRVKFGTIKRPEVMVNEYIKGIKPVTYLKSRAADLLKQINETHRPVFITQNGEPRGVLQDPERFENMRNAIGILKLISMGEEDIRASKIMNQDEVFHELEKSLKKK